MAIEIRTTEPDEYRAAQRTVGDRPAVPAAGRRGLGALATELGRDGRR